MIVATYNVNSIRAREPQVIDWLRKNSPDVLCLQETRVVDELFPKNIFDQAGYHVVFRGEKARNGVAIASKKPFDSVRFGFDDTHREGTRLVSVSTGGITIVNTYVPQGVAPQTEQFRYKIDWLKTLHDFFKNQFNLNDHVLWVGDFNAAPEPFDVYDHEGLYGHVGHHQEEIQALTAIKELGFIDVFRLHQHGPRHYTFWDYRIKNAVARKMGWRIDHIWATAPLAQKSTQAWIDIDSRLLAKPSDHTYLLAQFAL